jgi:hypothetical protein
MKGSLVKTATIKGKKIPVIFSNVKIRNHFFNHCSQAPKTIVDWEKFRELDKLGLFKEFSDGTLAMKYRTYTLKSKGLCYYCGVKPAIKKNDLCVDCKEMISERQAIRYKNRKLEAENA